jgi:signal transduction histidine kinase
MKLLQYTTNKLALLLFFLISIWSVFFYFAMHHEIMDETDDMLESYREIFVKKALNDPSLLNTSYESPFDRYDIRAIDMALVVDYKESWRNEEMYFPEGDEHIPMRVYKSIFRASDNRYYELEVRMSTVERDDMIKTLIIYLISLIAILLICIYTGNRIILKKSFVPLKKLLLWLNAIVPGKPVPPLDNDTKITEFRKLNEAALAMSRLNLEVYERQKQFTENAAHELQTPLAVALNKLDQFSQHKAMSEKQLSEIDHIYTSLNRAVRLNKSLLLLSRIENRQFPESVDVDINALTEEIMTDVAEIYEHKNIRLHMESKSACRVMMNETLSRILIGNLLKNAFHHTHNDEEITVMIEKNTFTVQNAGIKALDSEKIFNRFYQSADKKEDSTGLGLSIVKSICDLYTFRVSYKFSKKKHIFSINFN